MKVEFKDHVRTAAVLNSDYTKVVNIVDRTSATRSLNSLSYTPKARTIDNSLRSTSTGGPWVLTKEAKKEY